MPDCPTNEAIATPTPSAVVAVKNAVILAAGVGARLKEQGKLLPKGCMCLGGRSILEESILRLLSVGIERIIIATGHLAEQYEPLKQQHPDVIQFVQNPYYAESGSMYSLYCARDLIKGDFLLLESDLVYERRALTTCLEDPNANVILLAGLSHSSDEVFVETRNGNLVSMSKRRDQLGETIAGEMVGISKISRSLFTLMIESAETKFLTTRHVDYETDCLVDASKQIPIACPVVDDLLWCEIDDETHLVRAQKEIYPRVQELDAQSKNHQQQQQLQDSLAKFKSIGFFEEKELIKRYMQDFFDVINSHQIRACIMFGTLLGKLRHDDFIPWDDDVDIIVFDFDEFLEQCASQLEQKGYTVELDVRDGKRMGCRIFRADSASVPGKPNLRFPWIGIWEHEFNDDKLIVLPPEATKYREDDFFPLQQTDFLGIKVGVPHNSIAILNTYFESDDWMDVCQLPYRDHRNGGELTGFTKEKISVKTVLDYLASANAVHLNGMADRNAK